MSEAETRYEWIQTSGYLIICDFGQCERASRVKCKKCRAFLCLAHTQKHLRTCSVPFENEYVRMRFEQEIIDGKEWEE